MLKENDPYLYLSVAGEQIRFLVDTGATVSSIGDIRGRPPPLTNQTLSTMGFSGDAQNNYFTTPLEVSGPTACLYHAFIYSKACPVPLLGRDLLSRLCVSIQCVSEPLLTDEVTCFLPILVVPPPPVEDLKIHWLRLEPTPTLPTILEDWGVWGPWVKQQGTYFPPLDPPHTTMAVFRDPDEVYEGEWNQRMEAQMSMMEHQDIYVGPEGVAAGGILGKGVEDLFVVSGSAPHLTLAVGSHHLPAELGPMVARGLAAEWYPTDNPYLHWDREGGMYRISTPRRLAQVVGEVISRGQRPVEVTDAGPVEDPEVAGLLEGLPPNLWSSGPYDMGQTVHTVVTPLKPGVAPVNLPQYKVRPEARAGIDATIKGLKEAGVLIPSTSAWNTPILPVKKPDGTWRMAHDCSRVLTSGSTSSRLLTSG